MDLRSRQTSAVHAWKEPIITPVIELNSASVRAGSIELLRPVTESISAGQALTIRGRNGSGKSTLLRVLAGVVLPTEGRALVNGIQPDTRNRQFRRTVASMIGMPPLASDLTVREHVTLVAATWFARPADAEREAGAVLTQLELTSLGDRFPHELSSGQLQLFGFSLILARPSDIVIVDEPEQRLDNDRLGLVISLLNALKEGGTTLVVATHSSRLNEEIADLTINLDELP